MTYHIPEHIIMKGFTASKESPLPGPDAFAAGLRAIKDDLWKIITEEKDFNDYLNGELDDLNAEAQRSY